MVPNAFTAAPAMIQVHAVAALGATVIGAVQLLRPKGGQLHRRLGWAFVLLMVVVAGTSFFIHTICQIGGFSWIHLLSILTLVLLPRGVLAARAGRIAQHRGTMTGLYLFALILAGLFTLAPGRLMHQVVFGGAAAGFVCPAR